MKIKILVYKNPSIRIIDKLFSVLGTFVGLYTKSTMKPKLKIFLRYHYIKFMPIFRGLDDFIKVLFVIFKKIYTLFLVQTKRFNYCFTILT